MLNPIFDTKFPVSNNLDEGQVPIMLKILCNEIFSEFHVVFLDDVCLMDIESFKLIECIFNNSALFTIMALGRQKRFDERHREIFKDPRIVHHFLEPLDKSSQIKLACSYLGADGLSIEVEKFLTKNSDGVPGWIENYLDIAVKENGIKVEEISKKEAFDLGFDRGECKLAFFTQNPELYLESVGRTDYDLMIFDSLSTYEQLVCKCAAVIGMKFTRDQLNYVLSSSNERIFGKALVKLFEQRIISCATKVDEKEWKKPRRTFIRCNCKNVEIKASCRDLPAISCCNSMKFCRERFHILVYNSLTESQRLQFHTKALVYLHMESKKCAACNNKYFSELLLTCNDFDFHDGTVELNDTSMEKAMTYLDSINLPVRRVCPSRSKRSKSFKIRPTVLNFLNYDFSLCNCQKILHDVYTQMTRHCHGSCNSQKLIHTKIKLAEINIRMGRTEEAMNFLNKSSDLLDVSFFKCGK